MSGTTTAEPARPFRRLEPDLVDHLRIMWSKRWLVLAVAGCAALATYGVRSLASPTYEATATIRVAVRATTGQASERTDFLTKTYLELAATPEVLGDAITRAGVSIDLAEAGRRITTSTRSTAGFADITAAGPTATDAQALADATAKALLAAIAADQADARAAANGPIQAELEQIQQGLAAPNVAETTRQSLEARRAELARGLASAAGDIVDASIVVVAAAPTAPIAPHPARDALLVFLLVGIASAEGAVLSRRLRQGVSLADPAADIGNLLGVPAVVVRPIGDGSDSRSDAGEDRLVSFFLRHLEQHPVLTVVERGRAPSGAVAAQFATASAQAGNRTFLVDADPQDGALTATCNLGDGPGLGDVLAAACPLNAAVVRLPDLGGVVALRSARTRTDPEHGSLLRGRLNALVAGSGADTAVISSTSAGPLAETLLAIADCPAAVVVVLDPLHATRPAVEALADHVRGAGGRLVAAVLVPAAAEGSARLRRHLPGRPETGLAHLGAGAPAALHLVRTTSVLPATSAPVDRPHSEVLR